MYIAMSRFEVVNGEENQFEKSLREKHSQLINIPGYLSFHSLRGGTNGTVTFYSSHTTWANKDDFLKWRDSEQFWEVHSDRINIKENFISRSVLCVIQKLFFKSFTIRLKA